MGIGDKMRETAVLSQWKELMGDAIDKRTTRKNIREKILYLEINSAVMRDELQQRKSEIIQIINNAAGGEIVSDIFLK